MRRTGSGRFNCAMAGWSAIPVMARWLPRVRRYGRDRKRQEISAGGDIALLVAGERPGTDGDSHPFSAYAATRSAGAGGDPDSATVGDTSFDEPVRQVYGEHSSGAATCQLGAARSTDSRWQALHLAEGCHLAGAGE